MRIARALCVAGALVLCATPALAQFTGDTPTPASTACLYNFSAGGGLTLFDYCLTENGNIVKIEAPAGQNHQPGFAEGYAICSAAGVHGSDMANFIPVPLGPTAVISGCSSGSTCTLQRDTTDGVFRLIQKFSWNSKEREIDIDHTLVNLSGGAVSSVVLTRLTHLGVNNDVGDERGDVSTRSAWLADADMVSSTASTLTVPASTFIVSGFPGGCSPAAVATPAPPGAYANQINYNLGTIGSLKKKVVRVQIRVQ